MPSRHSHCVASLIHRTLARDSPEQKWLNNRTTSENNAKAQRCQLFIIIYIIWFNMVSLCKLQGLKLWVRHCQCNDKVLLWRPAYSWHVGRNTKNIANKPTKSNKSAKRSTFAPYLPIFCFSMKSSWRHVHVLTSSLLHPETLKASPCAVQTSTDGLPLKPSAQPAFTSKLKIWSDFACKAYLRRVESCLAGFALWCSGLLTTMCHQILRHKVVYGCLKLLLPYPYNFENIYTHIRTNIHTNIRTNIRTNIHIIRVQSYRLHCFVEEIQHHLGDMMTSVVVSDLQGDFTTLKVILDICQVSCLRNVSTKGI